MIRTKIACTICGQEISKSNINAHMRRHEKHPESFKDVYRPSHDTLECCFCGKVCKNTNSLTQHELRCPSNPNKLVNIVISPVVKKNHIPWNKGLTAETDDRVAKHAAQQREFYRTHPGSFTGKQHTEEYKSHMSKIAHERELGGFHMRSKGINYNGVKLDSSYELTVAQSLDSNNICWTRPSSLTYVGFDGKEHRYVPDFYLPEYDVYLDPKNDFLIHNVNPGLGFNDCEKIHLVENQLNVKVFVLDSDCLTWEKIHEKLLSAGISLIGRGPDL